VRRRLRYSTTLSPQSSLAASLLTPLELDGLQDGDWGSRVAPTVREDQVRDHLRNLSTYIYAGKVNNLLISLCTSVPNISSSACPPLEDVVNIGIWRSHSASKS